MKNEQRLVQRSATSYTEVNKIEDRYIYSRVEGESLSKTPCLFSLPGARLALVFWNLQALNKSRR